MLTFILFIRSCFFYLGFFSSLIFFTLFCITIGHFLPLKKRYQYFLYWNKFVIRWLTLCCGVKVAISGQENIPKHPVIVLSNHQSPWETIFLYQLFSPISAILKKELLSIPFFGWSLALLKPIAIDRKRKLSARQAILQQGKETLDQDISILIFPEGTRVKPGQNKKYQTGGTVLAIEAGATILPVSHNAGYCWPSDTFIKYPGTIKVTIGRPIATTGRSARELTQEVESWIKQN
ncbi:MAG: 1-acyl-sn-glycerol-3-phosphate acyltransferase [SAR86 cluster bacterium]|uniref:1-acyl-sn-glycerol-3-phosphate acyltransferase n=1 Tax=SAR86 cluster bacterium TaxID=2030880 RepID=A0A2A5CJ54_9GAMM|nr:1-acyl-sn-glycerol-3-phosphate acyltransferase [Gammaproteobacteria bacterium AH-315-E17]PCJ43545.1 MAG: 1-acyl-sn-glycerol-3-phosphate acyltransferase [SAR86 cluster bacterium]